MTDLDPTGGQTLLDQFTNTYLRYRWLIGAGIVAVTIAIVLLGAARPYIWVVTAAGLLILAHSLAIGARRFNRPLSPLVVDITVTNVALLVFGTANHDATAAKLGLVCV